ncbi:hypothetical protein [Cyclobacterium amurskyense]|uniref:Uncharacterized protein n=1 Tax=Cyclobacterium amurskyense TaxID=320787 RepID=A0A0H4PP23_9BACT|nr:hypothetical protein [Cyclobacterium amurskyense]AKP49972.1 hypothetical protein CA2015_0503 [Cyclobacterium amurskyense]
MDTDDLSIPTYKGIISEAEKFNHDLTLQFGVLASSCKDDDDYLNQAEALIKDWLQMNDFEDIIDGIFFGQKVNENAFRKTLNITLSNIAEIRKTPMEQREFEDWG